MGDAVAVGESGRSSDGHVRPRRLAGTGPDVVVLGEVLVELSSLDELGDGAVLQLGFSGDALNAAAAAAGAGAHSVLVARVPDDDLGDRLVARVSALGVDTSWIVRAKGEHGVYLTHADPKGQRQFTYVRRASAGSHLSVVDLDESLLSRAAVVVASGVTCAISSSAAETVLRAATIARRFVYDPNFRPRLTAPSQALALLRQLAPLAEVITPSWPEETRQLLDLPADAAAEDAIGAVTDLGSPGVVMTCGPEGALVVTGGRVHRIPGVPAPEVVDQTGAGDCLTGTLAARLAAGDSLLEAARLATAAASLSVQGRGGTGFVPTLQESRRAMAEAWPAKESTH